jgi:hypothetical protein
MNWNEILHKVVDEGPDKDIRYRVRHMRIFTPIENLTGELIQAKGGRTVVEIGHVKDGDFHVLVTGEARCHPNDNYDRKVGRDLALRDALRKYKEGS